MSVPDRTRAGFSTLEVLVALFILSLSASALTVVHHRSIMRIERAELELEAARTAESVLDRLGLEFPLETSTFAGEEKNGLLWKARVTNELTEEIFGLYRIEIELKSPDNQTVGRYIVVRRSQ